MHKQPVVEWEWEWDGVPWRHGQLPREGRARVEAAVDVEAGGEHPRAEQVPA